MLFMGSIFTSCIENVEPQGVLDVRESYANYLDKLAGLKQADAAVQQAEAAYRTALAAVQNGIAAQEQAKAEYYQLLNELQALQNDLQAANNEEAIQGIQNRMEQNAVKQEIEMAGLQAQLAEAQKNLADALAALEIWSSVLSSEEQAAINYIKGRYDYYAEQLAGIYAGWKGNLQNQYNQLYAQIAAGIPAAAAWEYILPAIEEEIELAELELMYAEQEAEYWKGLLNDFAFDYLAEAKAFEDSAAAMAPAFADLLRDSVIYANENGPIRDAAKEAADKEFEDAIKAPLDSLKAKLAAIPDKDKINTSAVSEDYMTGEATAKSKKYGLKKNYLLPEHNPAVSLVRVYENYLSRMWYNYNRHFIAFEFAETDARDTLFVTIPETATKALFQAEADSVWDGAQTSVGTLNMSTGLWSAYEDFSREYLYGMGLTELQADADALAAFRDSIQSVYDSILAILQNAPANQADILLKAWYDKVGATGEAIEELIETVINGINYSDDDDNNVYTYTVNTYNPARTFEGPIFLYNWTKGGKTFTKTADKKFDVDADNSFLSGSPDHNLSMAPTDADSSKVLGAINKFFKAIASIDEEAVPFLKYYYSTDGGATFTIQKVRADKAEYAGFKLRATDTYLEDGHLGKVATYDNKGIKEVAGVKTAAVANYYDAATNYIDLFLHYIYGTDLFEGLYDDEDDEYGFSEELQGLFDYVEWYTYGGRYDFVGPGANLGNKGPEWYRGVDIAYGADPDFAKYTAMSEEGQALYDWLEACAIYFGVDGFASIGEKVFFTYKTFAEPTMAVVYTGIPADGGYYKNEEGHVVGINLAEFARYINHYSSQYGFIINSIQNNIYAAIDEDQSSSYCPGQIDSRALVFELFAAEFLYNIASGSETADELWAKLGEVLQKVKKDLDKAISDTDEYNAKANAAKTAYNNALKDYRKEVAAAAAKRDSLKNVADSIYNAGLEELNKEFKALKKQYDHYMNMANGLYGAYQIHAGMVDDPTYPEGGRDIVAYCNQMYLAAVAKCAQLASGIATIEMMLEGISDPELDEIQAAIDAIDEVLTSMYYDEVADIEFWYEYWKAAYEAAIARYAE